MEELKEKQINRKEIYNGRVMDVVCDDVILQDGKASKREVVLHSGGVVILAIDKNNSVYIVKQYRYAVQNELYELPAGRLEKGEDPFECAKENWKKNVGLLLKLGKV
ncbi:MAG: NUDIX hydrolase [Candidatus Melainabacteria bacterium]|nr:MAG: NUDIX hydrolase [Candidatus Melainabacteria bacterium]